MTDELSLTASGLGMLFNRRTIFSGLAVSLRRRQSLGLTGRNGSGKSTLMKVLAGVLTPSAGTVSVTLSGITRPAAEAVSSMGFVAPYLHLYDEFSGLENLEFGAHMRGADDSSGHLEGLLDRVGLLRRKDDPVRTYSSGMKQRLKYAFAIQHAPSMLFLDEPLTNLDREGIEIVRSIIAEQKGMGIVLIATNDREDFRDCDTLLDLENSRVVPGAKTP